jgi:ATP-dependent Clp protease adaptor protein ClpS
VGWLGAQRRGLAGCGHAATAGARGQQTEAERQSARRTALLPPYHVILHNDDVNEMGYVVRSLLRCVPGLSREQATAIMLEAHHHGQAVVTTCPLELAELYRDRLESCGLTATIEPA